MAVDKRLKAFIENHIPFYELKGVGFWEKGTGKNNYVKIAARVCLFYGFQNIYEYETIIETHHPSPTVITGSFPDKVDKAGNLVGGACFHLDVAETVF